MSKKAVRKPARLSDKVVRKAFQAAGIKTKKPVSSATRRAKTAKVKSLKKPSTKAKFKVVTLFDGRPGVSDGEGNIAPFETLLTARRWRKWLTTGEEPSSALIWWNPKLFALRKAEWEKVHTIAENKKEPVEPKYVYSIVTMYDGDPGISDGQGNIAPFASLNGAQGRLKELVRGSSKHCPLIWMDPERYASKKLQWERDNPQTDEKPVEPQYVYTLVELKGGRWGISDGCGKVAPFGGSKIEVEGTRQRLVSEEFHHNRFAWTKEEPLHPVVENAPPVAHVWVQPGATSTIVEDTSKPPVWTAPVGMVLLDQAEHDYRTKLIVDLQTERDSLNNAVHKERGESAKWLNKYLQLCQLTGQRAEPEGLDHPSVQIVGVKFEPKESPKKDFDLNTLIFEALGEASMCWSETPKGVFDSDKAADLGNRVVNSLKKQFYPLPTAPNVFEQPASELTKLERAVLDLAPMLELSDLDTDVSIRRIERLVDFAASILSECHSQSK